jgi:hypothetical protein
MFADTRAHVKSLPATMEPWYELLPEGPAIPVSTGVELSVVDEFPS